MAVTGTRMIPGHEAAERIRRRYPDSVREASEAWVIVELQQLLSVAGFLRDDPNLDLKYLLALTAVDRLEYFEVAYHLQSLRHNHMLVMKTVAMDYMAPEVPSVVSVWQGALLQEREAYDLMGIRFQGHPDLRRLFLWDGFPGHPLRKDFLHLPGGVQPGLRQFPGEEPPKEEP